MLARRFRGLTVYSVSIGFSLIMGYVIIPIWTCAERNESAPIGFGLLDYYFTLSLNTAFIFITLSIASSIKES